MPPPVRIVFVAEGQAAVNNAFQSVAKQAQQLARAQARGAREGARESIKAANDGAKAQVKAAKTAQQELEKARTASARAAVKASQDVERAYEREMKAAIKSADAAVKASEKRAAAERKANEATARTAMRSVGGTARGISGTIGRAGRSTMGTVSGIAGGIGLAGGTYMVGNALNEAIDLKRQAALLSNATAAPGMAGRNPDELVKLAQGVSGFKSTDVMSAMQTVSARAGGGKGLAAFEKDINDVAKTAVAAGVTIEDMGAVYAAALNAGVAPGEEMRQLMIDLVQQGKAGAVEFKDLSTELARLGGAGRKFGSGADMLRKVSGLAQIAVESKVSPEESRSAVVDLLREMTMAEKISGMTQLGAKVAGEGGKLNDPAAIMAETIAGIEAGKQFGHKGGRKYGGATGEDKLGAYGYLFTGTSNDIAQTLRKTFLEAGGGEAGKAAVISRINEATTGGKEKMTASQRDREYGVVMGTESAQIGAAMKNFNNKITEMLPQFTKLIGPLTQAAEGFAKLAVYVSQNPFTGLGALFAANLTKEIAAAQVGNAINSGIKDSLSGKASLASISTITMTAAAVYLTVTKLIDEAAGQKDREGKAVQASYWEAENIRRGGIHTPEELAKAKSVSSSLAAEIAAPQVPSWKDTLTNPYVGPVAGIGYKIAGEFMQSFKEGGQGVAKGEELSSTKAQLDAAIKLAEAAGMLSSAATSMSGNLANPNSPERGP